VKSFVKQVVSEERDLSGGSEQDRLSLPSSQRHRLRRLVIIDVKYTERAEYVVLIVHLKRTHELSTRISSIKLARQHTNII